MLTSRDLAKLILTIKNLGKLSFLEQKLTDENKKYGLLQKHLLENDIEGLAYWLNFNSFIKYQLEKSLANTVVLLDNPDENTINKITDILRSYHDECLIKQSLPKFVEQDFDLKPEASDTPYKLFDKASRAKKMFDPVRGKPIVASGLEHLLIAKNRRNKLLKRHFNAMCISYNKHQAERMFASYAQELTHITDRKLYLHRLNSITSFKQLTNEIENLSQGERKQIIYYQKLGHGHAYGFDLERDTNGKINIFCFESAAHNLQPDGLEELYQYLTNSGVTFELKAYRQAALQYDNINCTLFTVSCLNEFAKYEHVFDYLPSELAEDTASKKLTEASICLVNPEKLATMPENEAKEAYIKIPLQHMSKIEWVLLSDLPLRILCLSQSYTVMKTVLDQKLKKPTPLFDLDPEEFVKRHKQYYNVGDQKDKNAISKKREAIHQRIQTFIDNNLAKNIPANLAVLYNIIIFNHPSLKPDEFLAFLENSQLNIGQLFIIIDLVEKNAKKRTGLINPADDNQFNLLLCLRYHFFKLFFACIKEIVKDTDPKSMKKKLQLTFKLKSILNFDPVMYRFDDALTTVSDYSNISANTEANEGMTLHPRLFMNKYLQPGEIACVRNILDPNDYPTDFHPSAFEIKNALVSLKDFTTENVLTILDHICKPFFTPKNFLSYGAKLFATLFESPNFNDSQKIILTNVYFSLLARTPNFDHAFNTTMKEIENAFARLNITSKQSSLGKVNTELSNSEDEDDELFSGSEDKDNELFSGSEDILMNEESSQMKKLAVADSSNFVTDIFLPNLDNHIFSKCTDDDFKYAFIEEVCLKNKFPRLTAILNKSSQDPLSYFFPMLFNNEIESIDPVELSSVLDKLNNVQYKIEFLNRLHKSFINLSGNSSADSTKTSSAKIAILSQCLNHLLGEIKELYKNEKANEETSFEEFLQNLITQSEIDEENDIPSLIGGARDAISTIMATVDNETISEQPMEEDKNEQALDSRESTKPLDSTTIQEEIKLSAEERLKWCAKRIVEFYKTETDSPNDALNNLSIIRYGDSSNPSGLNVNSMYGFVLNSNAKINQWIVNLHIQAADIPKALEIVAGCIENYDIVKLVVKTMRNATKSIGYEISIQTNKTVDKDTLCKLVDELEHKLTEAQIKPSIGITPKNDNRIGVYSTYSNERWSYNQCNSFTFKKGLKVKALEANDPFANFKLSPSGK